MVYSKKFLFVFLVLLFVPILALAQSGLVNINTAGVEELKTLNGIGDVKAQAIIDYRTQNGPFQAIVDIKNVSGIGEVTYSNIKDYITVGDTASSTTATTVVTTTEEATTTSTATSNVSTNAVSSVHYSSSPVTNINRTQDLVVGAGRDRLGSVGSPLEFKVEVNFGYTRNSIFKWNFGDGTERVGDVLNHTYEYPGEYVAVLNAATPQGQAVARVNVKIIEPEIVITLATSERVEIKNNSKYEVSLFGRALVAEGEVFVFPQDTIIKAGQKISFGSNVTGLDLSRQLGVSLATVGTEVRPQEVIAKIDKERQEKIAHLSIELGVLQDRLAVMVAREDVQKSSIIEQKDKEIIESQSQTALVLDTVSEEDAGNLGGWLETLKHFFFRTQ